MTSSSGNIFRVTGPLCVCGGGGGGGGGGIHRTPVNSPHKGQWRGALMFSLICAWINGWVNNREAGDLGRHHARYDVTVIILTGVSNCLCADEDVILVFLVFGVLGARMSI